MTDSRWKPGRSKLPNPSANILEGIPNIAEFFGRSYDTIARWIKAGYLPAGKTPQGRWFITRSLIDNWVIAVHKAELQSKATLRDIQANMIYDFIDESGETLDVVMIQQSKKRAQRDRDGKDRETRLIETGQNDHLRIGDPGAITGDVSRAILGDPGEMAKVCADRRSRDKDGGRGA